MTFFYQNWKSIDHTFVHKSHWFMISIWMQQSSHFYTQIGNSNSKPPRSGGNSRDDQILSLHILLFLSTPFVLQIILNCFKFWPSICSDFIDFSEMSTLSLMKTSMHWCNWIFVMTNRWLWIRFCLELLCSNWNLYAALELHVIEI